MNSGQFMFTSQWWQKTKRVTLHNCMTTPGRSAGQSGSYRRRWHVILKILSSHLIVLVQVSQRLCFSLEYPLKSIISIRQSSFFITRSTMLQPKGRINNGERGHWPVGLRYGGFLAVLHVIWPWLKLKRISSWLPFALAFCMPAQSIFYLISIT